MERNQFTFYRSFRDAIYPLPDKLQLALLHAILDYGLDGELTTEINPKIAGIFALIKPVLDTAARKASNAQRTTAKRKQNECKGEKEKELENELEKELEYELDIETETDKGKGVCVDPFFNSFWDSYPVQMDLQGAQEAWKRLNPNESIAHEILDSVKAWKASPRWRNEGGRYIPNAAAFLDKGYWKSPPGPETRGGPCHDLKPSGVLGEAERENIRRILGQSTIDN